MCERARETEEKNAEGWTRGTQPYFIYRVYLWLYCDLLWCVTLPALSAFPSRLSRLRVRFASPRVVAAAVPVVAYVRGRLRYDTYAYVYMSRHIHARKKLRAHIIAFN